MKSERMHGRPHLFGLIWPFVGIGVLQALLVLLSLSLLSSVRAYINGESLWSKGQKDAIYALSLYVDSGREADFQRYLTAISVPLGDHRARLAMNEPRLDRAVAEEGLLQGGNHPQDFAGMIGLYRYLGRISYLEQAIGLWAAADEGLLQLDKLGWEIYLGVQSGAAGSAQLSAWKTQIFALNEQLTPLEKAFSDTLGEGARAIADVLLAVNLGTALLLILLAVLRTRNLLERSAGFEEALHREQERAQVTLASIGDAVLTLDAQGRLDYLNPAAEQLIGWRAAQACGLPLGELLQLSDEQQQERLDELLEPLLDGSAGSTSIGSRHLLRADGSAVSVSLVAAPIHRSGTVSGAVLVFHDMTRERQYIANLSWQASHDVLTGLVNRREFDHRLRRALDDLQRHATQHALLYLDLDQFKVINDTCGHAAGDQLLRQVCAQLQGCLRDSDTLARLGGDEFGILLENCPPEPALRIAESLRQAVQTLHFSWQGRLFSIGVSIGLVCLDQRRTSLEEALRAADVACYMAKEKGRNRVQYYHPDDSELSLRYGELAWVQRIHQALDEQRFCLYAQEIMAADSLDDDGLHIELLVRLRDEDGQLVPPIQFIPAAERYGLMPLIDRWVVGRAFAILVERQQGGQVPIATCAINLSGATIGDEHFLAFLRAQFREHGIAPPQICFEITETSAIANLDSAVSFIRELQELGCRFALDDFGAGMSSFAYLKHLPVDYLKIDGGFVRDMLNDPIDRAMVEMISHLGRVMGKRTIAEFVENRETREALGDIGVDYVQGFGIARPRPFTHDSALLQENATLGV
ncbi:EAL domain-containing protein [Pseudomonas sp. UL073]|uniref:EAL domain-containing protein n=1 Tax=Zestomonas insulae TaxID=2809017 RepID=A0ABS2IMS7_9GAMM|nr:EAL domain-containing protein [Pseudomonas insulae]MBM7063183.1 EAL domain-containing protein [Pseudomonas insulae]